MYFSDDRVPRRSPGRGAGVNPDTVESLITWES